MYSNTQFRYSLDNSPKKHICPNCHKRRFVRYVDQHNDEYLPDKYGRCDREDNCGYHLNPYNDGYQKTNGDRAKYDVKLQVPITFHKWEYVTKSNANLRPEPNNLITFLKSKFNDGIIEWACNSFHIGTSREPHGATVFWQVDMAKRARRAKIMLYNKFNGHRVKNGNAVIFADDRLAKMQGITDTNFQQCLFGEHLLGQYPNATVCIVESEKTAIILNMLLKEKGEFGNKIFLARGGKNGCKIEHQHCLASRMVVLYPDLDAYEKWKSYANGLFSAHKCSVSVSDQLERMATDQERANGLDIADYLLGQTNTKHFDDTMLERMAGHLKNVTYCGELPESLKKFMEGKESIWRFIKTDNFSGRVHSPITNLEAKYRHGLRLYGEPLASLDISQSQPMILGKILGERIGQNGFSDWINSGTDIYEILMDRAKLSARADAKNLFYKIAFGKPDNALERMFGNSNWVKWVNSYKAIVEPENPKTSEEPHTNLAWLLQSTETIIMGLVWCGLILQDIPFLSIHDAILVRVSDTERAAQIFGNILSDYFTNARLTVEVLGTSEPDNAPTTHPCDGEPLPDNIKLLRSCLPDIGNPFSPFSATSEPTNSAFSVVPF